MRPRTMESEIDSISNVIARMLASGAKPRGKFRNRKSFFFTGSEDFHPYRSIREFIGSVGDEKRDAALHGVFDLIAERAIRQVDENTAALRSQRIRECLCGGDIACVRRAKVQLRLIRSTINRERMRFQE